MKKIIKIAIVLFAINAHAQQPFIELDREYILEFYENFNDNSLNFTNKWTFPENGAFHARGGGKNCFERDYQYFVNDGSNISYTGSSSKLTVKRENVGEKLTLDYESDNFIIQGCKNLREFLFTGEEIWSRQGFGYGVYEARIKFYDGVGCNQAFWMFSDEGYEIDVNEFRGDQPWTTHTNYHHFVNGDDLLGNSFSYDANNWPISSNTSLTQSYHIYTVKWTSEYINWYIDGVLFRHQEISLPSPQHMHIIFGVGVGGPGFSEHPEFPQFNSTTFPIPMEVDYVRYWSIGREFPNCTVSLSDPQPNKVYNSNKNITGSDEKHYQNSITTQSGKSIVIKSGADVWWTAGNFIELNDGFEVEDGATFTAEIIECDELFGRMANPDSSRNYTKATEEMAASVKNSSDTKSKGKQANENTQSKTLSELQTTNSQLQVKPNPSTDGKFNLTCTLQEVGCMDAEISVMNVLGEIIHKEPFKKYSFPMEIDLSSQPKGTYIVKIQNGETVLVYKVVAQ